MTIALRQYNKVYEKVLLSFLKNGKIPTFQDVVAEAGDDLPSVDSSVEPVFKYRPQSENSVFDIALYNKAVRSIKTDLEILFDETGQVQINNLRRISNADLFHSVHAHELNRLNKELDAILFATEGAEDNFFALFDNFDDLSKTDQAMSTVGAVDLEESALLLPLSLQGTLKISLQHLVDKLNPSLEINPPTAKILGPVPGTKYGNMFADKIQPWAVEIRHTENVPMKLRFTFQMAQEEFINRITATHHGSKPQKITLSTSVDNVNKKPIQDYSDGIVLNDQSHIGSFDFEERLTEFIHVTLSKEAADQQVDGEYQYIFGLKNISIFTAGRSDTAVYQSKPFDFSDQVSAIGKISISATEKLPDDTKIDWLVSVADKNGDVVGSFVPITPQNRTASSGPSKIVSLQDTASNKINFVTQDGESNNILTSQNIDFFNIQTIDTEPVFGTAALFRGYKSWLRDSSSSVNPVLVKDNFTPFSKGDTQQLYQVAQELTNGSLTSTSIGGSSESVVVLKKAPLYDANKGHTLIPAEGVNPDADPNPTYAIYSAVLAGQFSQVSLVGQNFSDGNQLNLGLKNIIYTGPGDIRIVNEDSGKVYQDGYDYIVQLDDDGNPTGIISALQASDNDQGEQKDLGTSPYPSVTVEYSVDPNLTRFVNKVVGQQVFFDTNFSLLPTSQVLIKYRHKAADVIKSSIKVKGLYGLAGNDIIFTQGQDYIYDSTTSQIKRLSTGSISSGADVYVDYKFNDLSKELDQFFIWAFVNKPKPVQISTEKKKTTEFSLQNVLKPDTIAGEEFLAQIPGAGLVDLTDAYSWPEMQGWVQFVVRSVPPENLTESSQVPLIHQIIKLKDEEGAFIFVHGGKYFEELTAIREPLTQVGFNFLKTNVLKNDNTKFAVRELVLDSGNQYQVIINFKPNTTENLYQYSAVGKGYQQNGLDGLYEVDEEWKLTWINKETAIGAYTNLIVQAILSRTSENANGNVTPKVFDYFVKVGY